jgi:CDGSH-type Zn-finger protein
VSPVLGPIRVEDPKVACKKYRWCSCGMSYKQPFCDNSHEGTLFKPLKFTI